jgi:hypothetical protein
LQGPAPQGGGFDEFEFGVQLRDVTVDDITMSRAQARAMRGEEIQAGTFTGVRRLSLRARLRVHRQ